MNALVLGAYTIWLRDLARFRQDRSRLLGAIAQPTLYLFILGIGISTIFGRSGEGSYLQFIYPGVIGMSMLFTSIFSAMSIIWDREFGFLKEVLVAPIPRSAIALGKTFGGATVATLQGTIILLYAPIIGIPLTPVMVVSFLFLMFAIAFAMTSLGVLVASRMRSMEGFQMVMNFLMMPLFLLSGAMFPLVNLPLWLGSLVAIDPLTYGVDALRNVANLPTEGAVPGLAPLYPLWLDVSIILGFGLAMVAAAVAMFNRPD